MSSRSNGVTKVLFTRRISACVVSSAACSASRIRRATSTWSAVVTEHLGQQPGTGHEVLGGFGEKIVERRVDGSESQTHG